MKFNNILYLGMEVFSFAVGFAAEVDGICGASVVAGEAVEAVALPLRAAVDEADVGRRAGFRA